MPGPQYAVGQRVEVLTPKLGGVPDEWLPGTVTDVLPMDNGRWNIEVTRDNGSPPLWEIVRKRGSECIRTL